MACSYLYILTIATLRNPRAGIAITNRHVDSTQLEKGMYMFVDPEWGGGFWSETLLLEGKGGIGVAGLRGPIPLLPPPYINTYLFYNCRIRLLSSTCMAYSTPPRGPTPEYQSPFLSPVPSELIFPE